MKINSMLVITILAFIILILSGAVYTQITFSENEQWKFAVLCDTRNDDKNSNFGRSGINGTIIANLSNEIVSENCDLVLVPGDMINGWLEGKPINGTYAKYKGQFDNWTIAMDPVYKNHIPIYTVRGNHEDGPGNYSTITRKEEYPYITHPDRELLRAYNISLGKYNPQNGPIGEVNLTYSFIHKNAFFVGLDNYANPHRVNQKWLDDQFAKNTKSFVFVFGHEPAFELKHPDCLATDNSSRSKFWDSLGRAGCRIYFCGHDHLYDRSHVPDSSGNNIYQMVIGSCGAPFTNWDSQYNDSSVIRDYYNNNTTGFAVVTIRKDMALFEWKGWNAQEGRWAVLDSFSVKNKEKLFMDPWTALGYLLLSGLLGAFGQGIRVVVGIKKQLDKASKRQKGTEANESGWTDWFEVQQLLVSLAIALVVGGIAGMLVSMQSLGQEITTEYMISIITIGYAGTDFIEGFIIFKRNTPQLAAAGIKGIRI